MRLSVRRPPPNLLRSNLAAASERAALAIGRLDMALYRSPAEGAWRAWSLLDATRRLAEADGTKVDLFRLSAFAHGLPLKLSPVSVFERGEQINSLARTLALRSWLSNPDLEMEASRDAALGHLQPAGANQLPLLGAAWGAWTWVNQEGSAPAVCAALPLYLADHRLTGRPLPSLIAARAFKDLHDTQDQEAFALQFLGALRAEAENAHDMLLRIERAWAEGRRKVAALSLRSSSRLPSAVDMLAASPLLTISALAQCLDCSVKGASKMVDELLRHEIAVEVTGTSGRGVRRLVGLKHLAPVRSETTATLRRSRIAGSRGRPKRILVAPFSELKEEPQAPSVQETATAPEYKPERFEFDFSSLDRASKAAEAQTRRVSALLRQLAVGPHLALPPPAPDVPEEEGDTLSEAI